MPYPRSVLISVALLLSCAFSKEAFPQQPGTAPSAEVERLAGTEASSRIQYARLVLKGSLHSAAKGAADPPAPTPPPVLVAQCTLKPTGKYAFELFASFGGATDLAYYPPWVPLSSNDLFPPRTEKRTITMEFLGYTRVKPVRRQWEIPTHAPDLLRYNPPSLDSANMEEIAFYLRYLAALPTLRLTLNDRADEFVTTPLLDAIRKEPLCRAASI